MKMRLNPVAIALKDLPAEGRDYEYTRESGELNDALKDLLLTNDYNIKLFIKPMGNAYEMKAQLSTQMNLQCSLCATEFKQELRETFHEYLVIQKPLEKGEHVTRANHAHEWEAQGPEATLLESEIFNVGEYIHEQIALAEPIRPLCKPEDKHEGLDEVLNQRSWLSVGPESNSKDAKANPFKILEKIKLRS